MIGLPGMSCTKQHLIQRFHCNERKAKAKRIKLLKPSSGTRDRDGIAQRVVVGRIVSEKKGRARFAMELEIAGAFFAHVAVSLGSAMSATFDICCGISRGSNDAGRGNNAKRTHPKPAPSSLTRSNTPGI